MIEKEDVIKLENNIEYAVLDIVVHNNKKYGFLVNLSNPKDYRVCLIENEEHVYDIDEDEEKKLFMLFFKQLIEANKD